MTLHPAAHSGGPREGLGVGSGDGVGRLDSHLAHSFGETARNIFRSSLNREERKGRDSIKYVSIFGLTPELHMHGYDPKFIPKT